MEDKLMHIMSTIAALIGTWLLAFGLRIKEGIDPGFRKTLGTSLKDLIIPADVTQRPALFRIGLGLITFGALLELWIIIFK